MNMDSDLESDDEFFENFENIVDKETSLRYPQKGKILSEKP
jgi:hypothetical protein